MNQKPFRFVSMLLSTIALFSLLLAACTPAAAPTTSAAEPEEPASKMQVGIVLPTKDEPRWIQDETRFKDAHIRRMVQPDVRV